MLQDLREERDIKWKAQEKTKVDSIQKHRIDFHKATEILKVRFFKELFTAKGEVAINTNNQFRNSGRGNLLDVVNLVGKYKTETHFL